MYFIRRYAHFGIFLIPYLYNFSTNTDVIIDEREDVIRKLKTEVEMLRKENDTFRNFFSPAQVNKLKEPRKRGTWAVEDICKVSKSLNSNTSCLILPMYEPICFYLLIYSYIHLQAIVIHSAGARAYKLLLKKGYPLPCVSTLRGWCKKIKLEPGILKKVRYNSHIFLDAYRHFVAGFYDC